jgi:hypothetical protein
MRTCGIQVKTRSSGAFLLGDRLIRPVERNADEWVILVTLAKVGERSHFHVVPRNHVAAAMVAYAGSLDASRPWKAKYLGDDVFGGYDEAWPLMEHPAAEARWAIGDWYAKQLADQGREDIFALVLSARPS